jgi:hypothetical protein
MTTAQELKERYDGLFDYMASSKDPRNMKLFGCVMTEMMAVLIQKMPDTAEEMVDKLESIKWKQYLTPKEADAIVAGMDPKAPWGRDQWKAAMESFGLPIEDAPRYNRCALWVEMNKMYSDFGEEIASLLGKPLVPTDKDIIAACYKMALKTLNDKDGVYDIRKYFLWQA